MVGLDVTESEFDVLNARLTADGNADGLQCISFADKSCPTVKGWWIKVTGFEKYFTAQEIASAIPYVRIEEEVIVI